MHSSLLVDLGQASSTTSSPSQNLLTDPDLLQYILKHPDDTFRNNPTTAFNATRACTSENSPGPLPCYNFFSDINMFAPPGTENTIIDPDAATHTRNTPMPDSYNAFHDKMGPLGTTNTTIFRQYACQVPKRKPVGTMVITVLVADMVFLQACWVLLRLVADYVVKNRGGEGVMWCDGCEERGRM